MGISSAAAICWILLLVCFCRTGRVEAMCLNNSHFEMTDTSNSAIDKTWFSNCELGTHFNISNNKIEAVQNEDFNTSYNVQLMDLHNNNISVIEQDAFAIMRKLQFLYLSNNEITELPSRFFHNKIYLQIVDLSYNMITHIPRNVLEYYLKDIEQIILHHNRITSFEPWAVFRNAIPMFDVRYNNISTFSNVYNWTYDSKSVYDRKTTDLRNNTLTTWHDWYVMQYKMPNSTTNAVESALVEIMPDLRENPLTCDCNIYNLTKRTKGSFFAYSDSEYMDIACYNPPHLRSKLIISEVRLSDFICNVTDDCPTGCLCQDLPYNETLNVDCRGLGLKDVPSKVPVSPYNRISLQLDDNFITTFKNVSYLPYIYSVTMSNNTLRTVPKHIMKEIASKSDRARIDFSNNSLTSIPPEAQNMKYEHAQLNGNNLECSCDMIWMVDWITIAPKFSNKKLSCTFEGATYTIMDLDEDTLNCRNIGSIILVVVLAIVCVVVVALLITAKRCPYETKVLLFKIFRIHPSDKYQVDKTSDKEYDMYVCYDDNDIYVRQWVKNKLFKQLEEKKPFYRLCAAERNAPAGGAAEGRLQLIEESRRILIILSKDFDMNEMCKYEIYQAETLEQNQGRVMYLLYDKCAENDAKKEPKHGDRKVFRLLRLLWSKPEETMKDRKVFHLHDRLLWSKLRYELPRKPLQKRVVNRNNGVADSRVNIDFN